MSREIKFRAWEPQYKLMSQVNFIMFDTNEIDCHHNSGEPKSMEHFEIMQFTGLKDKNGMDIYEGDIIKYISVEKFGVDNSTNIVEVKYDEYGFLPFTLNTNCEDDYYSYALLEVEVLGNKFQNPELLKRLT